MALRSVSDQQVSMKSVGVLVFALLVAFAASDRAIYVPKAFYLIDQNGAASEPILLLGSANILRARRSALPNSVSSSSSSSSSSGGGYGQSYSSSSSNSNFGNPYGPVYQPAYVPPAAPYGGAVLHSRFADDGPVSGIGLSGTSHGSGGVFSGSSSTVDSHGNVHYSTHTGKFRK